MRRRPPPPGHEPDLAGRFAPCLEVGQHRLRSVVRPTRQYLAVHLLAPARGFEPAHGKVIGRDDERPRDGQRRSRVLIDVLLSLPHQIAARPQSCRGRHRAGRSGTFRPFPWEGSFSLLPPCQRRSVAIRVWFVVRRMPGILVPDERQPSHARADRRADRAIPRREGAGEHPPSQSSRASATESSRSPNSIGPYY